MKTPNPFPSPGPIEAEAAFFAGQLAQSSETHTNRLVKSDKELFFEALELVSTQERDAFLHRNCPNDAERVSRLRALLVNHLQQDDFMGVPAAEAPAFSELVPEEPDTMIGRYKLLEKLGEGGFGVVYVAEQKEPVKRRVALKIIKLGMDTRQVVARFEAERQALAMMDHPNIAKVFDGGAIGAPDSQLSTLNSQLSPGRPYFVMELVRGSRITQYCEENNLPIVERLKLFILVCHAIQHAHQKGIIHRDIKPSNIIITSHDGVPVPKVIDFGIAKAIEGDLTEKTIYTQHHQFIGTPAYMSPEQAELSALGVDTRTDVYALGVVLYELLTGTTPFDAQELLNSGLDQMRRTIREKDPVRPSTRLTQLVGDGVRSLKSESLLVQNETTDSSRRLLEVKETVTLLKGDLDWIVMKCLEKDRTRRYETVNGLARDLERYLNNEPVSAAAPTAAYKLRKFVRRNRTPVIVGATVAALVLIGLVVSTALAIWATNAERQANLSKNEEMRTNQKLQEQLSATIKERTRADAEKSLAQRHLYIARLNLAQRAMERNDLGRVRQILDQTADFPDRGFEWFYLQREAHFELRTLRGHTSLITAAAFSPDGLRAVTGAEESGAKIWDVASGRELATLGREAANTPAVGWSPDGRWIATGSYDSTVRILDAKSFAELKRIQTGNAVRSLAISPQGNRLAFGYGNGSASIYELPTDQFVCKVAVGPDAVSSICFSPDGEQFVAAGGRNTFQTWNARTGQEVTSFPAHQGPVRFLAWSPDGRRIVSGGDLNNVEMWEAATGRELFSISEPGGSIWSVAFSSDSQNVAVGRVDGYLQIRNALDGFALFNLKTAGSVFALSFSPDTRQILLGMGENAALWKLAGPFGPSLRLSHAQPAEPGQFTATVPKESAVCLAFSPDSKEIITGGRDRLAKVWETSSGRLLFTFEGHEGAVTSVNFSPDGSRILTRCDPDTLRVWDKASHRQIIKVTGMPFAPFSFSPDGTAVVGVQGGNAVIWDSSSGAELCRVDNEVNAALLSSDGRRLLTAGAFGTARIWDPGTKQLVRILDGAQTALWGLAVSTDGTRIATGSFDGSVITWDSESGQVLHRLQGHRGPIWSVAFSADGKRIVTGSGDQTTRLWDAETGLELLVLRGQTDIRATISPNAQYIASLDRDAVKLWIAASPEEMAAWKE